MISFEASFGSYEIRRNIVVKETLKRFAVILFVALLLSPSLVVANEAENARLLSILNDVLRQQIEAKESRQVLDEAGVRLDTWHRIGPFRDQLPLLNWMDNVLSSFAFVFDVEKETLAAGGIPQLGKSYKSPNFPATPDVTRRWTAHPEWIDGYYQELPRGPAPSPGESQFLYRKITVDQPVTVSLDFILRSPEADRRMNEKGMEDWRRTGRYHVSLNGEEILRWDGRGNMPNARTVELREGDNHLFAKVTNNRHAYGFAFSIKGLHPALRHEVGFERMWRPHIMDMPSEHPYHMENGAAAAQLSLEQRYRESLIRLRELRFYPQAMPGVESAARDRKGRIVPAMEAGLEKYPTSPAGNKHTARLAKIENVVRPLLERLEESDDPLKDEVFRAVDMIEAMWNETIRELPKLVYLERPSYVYDSMMYEGAGTRDATIKSFHPAGKKIETVYDFRSDKDRPAGANEINVSWDGRTIFIGGNRTVAAIDSDGNNYRRITVGQSPAEMPDGRIVFFDSDVGQSPCKGGGPRRLLFICDPDGENRKLVSSNNTIDTAPSIMNDGRVIFTRWDYGVNKNVFNRHALWTQNPDGTGIDLFFGNTVIDPRSFGRARQIPGRPEVVTIFGPHHAKLTGLIGLAWNEQGKEARDGLGFRRITHDTASVGDAPQPWSYQDPYPLNEQLFLVSFGGRPGHKVALYLYDRSGNRKCIIESASASGIHTAQPFVAKQRPPVIPNRSTSKNWIANVDLHQRLMDDPNWEESATMMLQDVYLGIEPEVRRGDVKYIAVMEQPAQSHGRGGSIGVGTIWYVNRLVGLVPVESDGSAYFEVPAMRSIFFHVLDKDGKMLMTQGSDFHAMPGEVRSCVGCHEQRKGIMSPPGSARTPLAMRKPPVRPQLPGWGTRGIIEYETVVQPVLDKYCISCHQGPKPKGNLNLTGDRTTVYNMSYMELTDRSLVHFTPGTGRTHAQPSNDSDEQAPLSRGSVISKIADHLDGHPHCGQAIPFEEKLKIFLWIDSNVPYYSHYRQKSPTHLAPEARNTLRGVWDRRCASCHNQPDRPDTRSGLNIYHTWVHAGGRPGEWGVADSGMRVRHMNLTNPDQSGLLQAPLTGKAGGWNLCKTDEGQAIFESKNDPDYKTALEALKQVVQMRDDIPYVGVKELLRRRAEEEAMRTQANSTP